MCSVFVHNDAGISYLATIQSMSNAKLFAILFGPDVEALTKLIEFKCEMLVAKAVHNPIPLKNKVDIMIKEVKRWAV